MACIFVSTAWVGGVWFNPCKDLDADEQEIAHVSDDIMQMCPHFFVLQLQLHVAGDAICRAVQSMNERICDVGALALRQVVPHCPGSQLGGCNSVKPNHSGSNGLQRSPCSIYGVYSSCRLIRQRYFCYALLL